MTEFIKSIFSNHAIVAPFIAWITAQLFKTVAESVKQKKLQWERLLGTGGMPSAHTSYITCLATSIGLISGFESPAFAISVAFAIVVMYDATGIRQAAGKQATILNMLLHTNKENIHAKQQLKEKLGHSPLEVVVGAFWGVLVAAFYVAFIRFLKDGMG